MKKKLLTVALAAVMVVSSAFSAMAELVEADTTFTGKVADGSAAWNSAGTGVTFPINEEGVTVVFKNDAFTDSVDNGNGDKFGTEYDNWDNFVVETIATETTKGATMRADAFSWTYGEGTNVPTITPTISWDWADTNFDWHALTDDTTVTVVAKKTDANTVTFDITFASDASAKETYTLVYSEGVPSDLAFQIGADGGKMELVSATFGSSNDDSNTNDDANNNAGDNADNDSNADSNSGSTTPDTGDSTMVGLLLAVAAVSVVVVLKRRTVAE